MSIIRSERIKCPKCGEEIEFRIWDSLNTGVNPEAAKQLRNGSLFQVTCPKCRETSTVLYSMIFHDMVHHTVIAFSPDNEEKAYAMITPFAKDFPKFYSFRVVTQLEDLIEKANLLEEQIDDKLIEIIKFISILNANLDHPGAKIKRGYFVVEDGQYSILYFGDILFKSDINKESINILGEQYKTNSLDGEGQFQIDQTWAKEYVQRYVMKEKVN